MTTAVLLLVLYLKYRYEKNMFQAVLHMEAMGEEEETVDSPFTDLAGSSKRMILGKKEDQ